MNIHAKIGQAIRDIANAHVRDCFVFGEVSSIDLTTRTCEVLITSSETQYTLPNVYLQAAIGDGLVLIPTLDSTVLVYNDEKTHPVILSTSDVDKVYMNSNLFQFNGGENGGLINIVPLVEKINAIEKLLNDLQDKFNSWVVTPNDGGLALKTILTVTPPIWNMPHVTLTTKSDIEDTKITH